MPPSSHTPSGDANASRSEDKKAAPDHPKTNVLDEQTRQRLSALFRRRIALLAIIVGGALTLALFVSPSRHVPRSFGPNKYCEFDTCKNLLTKEDFSSVILSSDGRKQGASDERRTRSAAVVAAVSDLPPPKHPALSTEERVRLEAQLPLRDKYLAEADHFLAVQVPTLRSKFNQFPDPKPLLDRLQPLEDEARALQTFLRTVELPVSDQVGTEFLRRRDAVAHAYALLLDVAALVAEQVNALRDAKVKIFISDKDFQQYPFVSFQTTRTDTAVSVTIMPTGDTLYRNEIALCSQTDNTCAPSVAFACATPSSQTGYCKGPQTVTMDAKSVSAVPRFLELSIRKEGGKEPASGAGGVAFAASGDVVITSGVVMPSAAGSSPDATHVEVRVDAGKTVGQMPPSLFGVGTLSFAMDPIRNMNKDDMLRNAYERGGSPLAYDSVRNALENHGLDEEFKAIISGGGIPLITFWGTPQKFSPLCTPRPTGGFDCVGGDKGHLDGEEVSVWGKVAPRDQKEYENFIYRLASNLTAIGVNYYEVWNEPDCGDAFWQDTEENFYLTIESMMRGVKRANSNAKIVFPAACTIPSVPRGPAERFRGAGSFLRTTLRRLKQDGYDSYIDMISWHEYYDYRINTGWFAAETQKVRDIIAQEGYSPSLPLIVDEWSYGWSDVRSATEIGASVIGRYMRSFLDNNLRHAYWGDADHSTFALGLGTGGLFAGGADFWDLKDHFDGDSDNIARASYNAFRALKKLDDTRISAAQSNETYVTTLATKSSSGSQTSVLLSNFENPLYAASTSADYLASQGITYLLCPPSGGVPCPAPKPYTADITQPFFSTVVPAAALRGWDARKDVGFLDAALYLLELQDCIPMARLISPLPYPKKQEQKCSARYPLDIIFKYLPDYIDGIRHVEDITDPKVRQDVINALAIYNLVITDQQKIAAFTAAYQLYTNNVAPAQTVNLTIQNLVPGSYTLTRYLIDKDHSNSCRLNKKTEPSPSKTECGVNGIIDTSVKQAGDAANTQAAKTFQDYFRYPIPLPYAQQDIDYFLARATEVFSKTKTVEQALQAIKTYCQSRGLNPDQCVTDVTNAYTKAVAAYDTTLQQGLDAINNMDGVRLYQESSTIQVSGSSYQTTLSMQPYSVMEVQVTR